MNLKHIKRSSACLNCGHSLNETSDNYCPECGQLNSTAKETAVEMIRELAGDFLHLDSKVTRSLLPLLFKPGKLTLDYIEGKRARYFHPVRLFLTVTVIMFIVIGFTSKKREKSKALVSKYNINLNTEDGLKLNPDTSYDNTLIWDMGDKSVSDDSLKWLIKEKKITNTDQLLDTLGVEKNFISRLITTQIIKSKLEGFEKLSDYFKHKLPWIIFALMPVFAFIMWLIYLRRKIYFSDHLIYAFHLHTAAFLIASIARLLDLLSDWAGYILLLLPIYYFVSLHKVYGQTWIKTILKGVLIGALYLVIGFVTLMLIMATLFVVY